MREIHDGLNILVPNAEILDWAPGAERILGAILAPELLGNIFEKLKAGVTDDEQAVVPISVSLCG